MYNDRDGNFVNYAAGEAYGALIAYYALHNLKVSCYVISLLRL